MVNGDCDFRSEVSIVIDLGKTVVSIEIQYSVDERIERWRMTQDGSKVGEVGRFR